MNRAALVAIVISTTAFADGITTWPKRARQPNICETKAQTKGFGDPVVTGSSTPFSTKWDSDVSVATPRGTFVLMRQFTGDRRALGQTEEDAPSWNCTESIIGRRRPGMVKAPYGNNFVNENLPTGEPSPVKHITINTLSAIVDTRCAGFTRVLTPDGDVRFFGAAPTVPANSSQWVPRHERALSEPSRLRFRRSATEQLFIDWFAENGRRFVFALPSGQTLDLGQYRLTEAYRPDGALFFSVTYAMPSTSAVAGANGQSGGQPALKADGGFKPYVWEPVRTPCSPACNANGNPPTYCDWDGVCRATCMGGNDTCTAGGVTICTDKNTDHDNCGSCGSVCSATQYCRAGQCATQPAACDAQPEPVTVTFPETSLQMRLVYRNPPSFFGGSVEWTNSECVVDHVDVLNGSNAETLVQYNYSTSTNQWGFAVSALQSVVFAADGGTNAWKLTQPLYNGTEFNTVEVTNGWRWTRGFLQTYPWEYPDYINSTENSETHQWQTVTSTGPEVLRMREESDPSIDTARFVSRSSAVDGCTNCCNAETYSRGIETTTATNAGWVTQKYFAESIDGGPTWNALYGPLPASFTRGCYGSQYSCAAGSEGHYYGKAAASSSGSVTLNACGTTTQPVVEVASKNRLGSFTQNVTTLNGSTGAFEVNRVVEGASAATGGAGLLSSETTYSYPDQQVVVTSTEPSVLSSSGLATTTIKRTSTGRVTAVIRSGTTLVNAQERPKHIAVFYRTGTRPCGSGAEATGSERITAVEGPCEVTSTTATTCSQFSETGADETYSLAHPITEYFYYGGVAPSGGLVQSATDHFNSGRLAIARTFTNGCAGTALDYQFGSYSASGEAGRITDPNGGVTQLTWQGGLLTKVQLPISGVEYVMEWDRGRLGRIQRPEGDSTVYCTQWWAEYASASGSYQGPRCMRTASLTPSGPPVGTQGTGAPSGGTPRQLSDKPAWVADVGKGPAFGTLRTWAFEYDRDEVARASLFTNGDPNGTGTVACDGEPCVLSVSYRRDLEQRPSFVAVGKDAANTDWKRSLRFDSENNLAASGGGTNFSLSGNPGSAGPYCGIGSNGTGGEDPRCTFFARDRLGRLTGSAWGGDGLEDCFAYDAHGNISVVAQGCSASGSGSVCPANVVTTVSSGAVSGGPTCGRRMEYIWDDFGRLVTFRRQVDGQWSRKEFVHYPDGAIAFTRNQVELDPANNEAVWTLRDRMGRPTETIRVRAGDPIGLTATLWDTAPSLRTGCEGGLPSSLTARKLKGNVGYSEDPVWYSWFAYDGLGRLVTEQKVSRASGADTLCANGSGGLVSANTRYAYRGNGGLHEVQHPHGRRVRYRYPWTGDKDINLPNGVAVDFFQNGQVALIDIITDVEWTPDKRLSSYRFRSLAGLSFNGETPNPVFGAEHVVSFTYGKSIGETPETCFAQYGSNDGTGRLRSIRVDDQNGTPTYERIYTWSADQVMRVDVCYRSDERPLNLVNIGSLTQQGKILSNLSTGRPELTLDYDSSGERSGEGYPNGDYWLSANAASGEILSLEPQQPSDTVGQKYYTYDSAGRQTQRSSALNKSGAVNNKIATGFPDGTPQLASGVESVLRTVEMSGDDQFGAYAVPYNYYYDGSNKRVRKDYPNGASEYFFYNQDKQLIAERSFEHFDEQDGEIAIDDYVYLGGVPVAAVLGQLSSQDGTRIDDLGSSCARRNVARRCGAYHILSDYQGTPVVTFDPALEVSGVGEYDLFGHRNRRRLPSAESQHPHGGTQTVASGFGVAPAGDLATQVRLRVSFLDADGPPSPYIWAAQVELHDSNGFLSYAAGTMPNMVTEYASGNSFDAVFMVDGWNVVGRGAVVEAFEYERVGDNVERYFPPLRFPGQYFDEETDYFENWNRYYDPENGRYLAAEPLFQDPEWIAFGARQGQSPVTYGYAYANPVRYTDPTGLGGEWWNRPLTYDSGPGGSYRRSSVYQNEQMGRASWVIVAVLVAELVVDKLILPDQPWDPITHPVYDDSIREVSPVRIGGQSVGYYSDLVCREEPEPPKTCKEMRRRMVQHCKEEVYRQTWWPNGRPDPLPHPHDMQARENALAHCEKEGLMVFMDCVSMGHPPR